MNDILSSNTSHELSLGHDLWEILKYQSIEYPENTTDD